jgi:hypothetical protein
VPAREGHSVEAVHLTAEQNNSLTLVSTDETTIYFDISRLAFTSSLADVMPTITPAPSYTPPVFPTPAGPPTAYPEAVMATPAPAPSAKVGRV